LKNPVRVVHGIHSWHDAGCLSADKARFGWLFEEEQQVLAGGRLNGGQANHSLGRPEARRKNRSRHRAGLCIQPITQSHVGMVVIVMMVFAHAVFVHHLISTAKALAKISAFVAGKVGVPELVMSPGIRRTMCVDVVTRSVDTIAKAAVPRA
jgi:hypothetical protein